MNCIISEIYRGMWLYPDKFLDLFLARGWMMRREGGIRGGVEEDGKKGGEYNLGVPCMEFLRPTMTYNQRH